MVYLTSVGSPQAAVLWEMPTCSPMGSPAGCREIPAPVPGAAPTHLIAALQGCFSHFFPSLLGSVLPVGKYLFPAVLLVSRREGERSRAPWRGRCRTGCVRQGQPRPSPHRAPQPPPPAHAHQGEWQRMSGIWEILGPEVLTPFLAEHKRR